MEVINRLTHYVDAIKDSFNMIQLYSLLLYEMEPTSPESNISEEIRNVDQVIVNLSTFELHDSILASAWSDIQRIVNMIHQHVEDIDRSKIEPIYISYIDDLQQNVKEMYDYCITNHKTFEDAQQYENQQTTNPEVSEGEDQTTLVSNVDKLFYLYDTLDVSFDVIKRIQDFPLDVTTTIDDIETKMIRMHDTIMKINHAYEWNSYELWKQVQREMIEMSALIEMIHQSNVSPENTEVVNTFSNSGSALYDFIMTTVSEFNPVVLQNAFVQPSTWPEPPNIPMPPLPYIDLPVKQKKDSYEFYYLLPILLLGLWMYLSRIRKQ